MFYKYLCGFKNTDIIDMDKTNHYTNNYQINKYDNDDSIECDMNIIKQKIEHYVILDSNELKFIKKMDKEQIYELVLWYNKNNAKY
jgi:hypothetical protein